MKYRLLATVLAASLSSLPTQAAETELDVKAVVPAALSLITPDGQPLSGATVELPLNPQTGQFDTATLSFKVRTNSNDQTFKITNRGHDVPTLRNSSGQTIELSVTLEGADMVKKQLNKKFDDIFKDTTLTATGVDSTVFDIKISPRTPAVMPAGTYTGNFKFYVEQKL